MTNEIPNLWPTINADIVRSPSFILGVQASNLQQMTNGLLEGEVIQTNVPPDTTTLSFAIVAPHIGRYRFELFRLQYPRMRPYPLLFSPHAADEFASMIVKAGTSVCSRESQDQFMVSSQGDLLATLRLLFRLPETVQVLDSLLALTSEEKESIDARIANAKDSSPQETSD